jgi:hypothetical protein
MTTSPILLADYRNITGLDDVSIQIVDPFLKSNFLMQKMPFNQIATKAGNTITAVYPRVSSQPTAASRAFNTEYDGQKVTTELVTVSCKILGGRFDVDRVFANLGNDAETVFQLEQLAKAATAEFCYLAINGDHSTTATDFDGLKVLLAGNARQELNVTVDWTGVMTADNANASLQVLDDAISRINGIGGSKAGVVILVNRVTAIRLNSIARKAGYHALLADAFGEQINTYQGIPVIEMGDRAGADTPVIPVLSDGTTSIYIARLGVDGFHAVSPSGTAMLQAWVPFTQSGNNVNPGGVELVAAVALVDTRAAVAIHGVKVQAPGDTSYAPLA